jgi:4-deoxy-L-threo-5-hexosulose-uronate ketol-isomerase
MKTYLMADPVRYPRMTSSELRESFLIDSLSAPGEIRLAYVDRSVVGIASPSRHALSLPGDPMLKAQYFLERREL